jgi:hypothetical protein
MSTTQPRIDYDLVADLDMLDLRTNGLNDTDGVGPEYMGHL